VSQPQSTVTIATAMTQTWREYCLTMMANGEIIGDVYTNQEQEDGPQEWKVEYTDFDQMLVTTGGTHTGVDGTQVTVYLDGEVIDNA
jgi:hypothetical protein